MYYEKSHGREHEANLQEGMVPGGRSTVPDLQRYVKDLFLSVYGTAPAEEKAGAVGLIKRGFSYGTE